MSGQSISRHIPTAVKQEVRKRCGFGCVICGLPVFQYDHMEEFSVVKRHEAENITCLCGVHHDDKTYNRLPLSVVRAKNADPVNIKSGSTTPHMWYFGDDVCRISLGNSSATTDFTRWDGFFNAIEDGKETLLGFRKIDNVILLTMILRDKALRPLVKIVDNELVLDTGLKDVRIEGPRLVVKLQDGDQETILLKQADGMRVEKGVFYGRLSTLTINASSMVFNPGSNFMSGITAHNCRNMINLSYAS